MSGDGALTGMRVVELGQYVAAPFAASILADEGAEVVKVERPGGDPYRADPARFAAWNRGKRSIEVDLASLAGRAELLELLVGADVVIENLRPGALDRLGLGLATLRDGRPRLVTCSITAWGSSGPGRDDPGWEPLVHARAGAQQGQFTGDEPMWLPFPMASIGAGLLAVIGVGAALVKRESTGYGQHVDTSLLDALLFVNGGALFHRPGHRPGVTRTRYNPVLHTYESADGKGMQINLSGTARWREVCRLIGLDDDGGLDFDDPKALAKLGDREWSRAMVEEVARRFAAHTGAEWEEALLESPAPVARCNTLEEWLAHEQVAANDLLAPDESGRPLVAPPVRIVGDGPTKPRIPRHGGAHGALAGHRVLDISSFWAGPLAARILGELGADVVKVEPPGGEGSYALMSVLPNIYIDANRSKRGLTLDLRTPEDRERFLELVRSADVVVENAIAGTWERQDLGEERLRAENPAVVYARSKGFGMQGPLAARPSFDYVVQGATGMVTAQGGGRAVPMNFTANDYGTGLHLAAGMVLALLARARGSAVTTVEASLMMTATWYQAEQVAALAFGTVDDPVGPELRGPSAATRLYRATDGWVLVCAVTPAHHDGLRAALGLDDLTIEGVAAELTDHTTASAVALLADHGVPATRSLHPNEVPDDPQVVDRRLLTETRHPAAGRFVQVGIPLRLSVDAPGVKGAAPTPWRPRRPT